jgi:uncharacterized DUF497 family protein
VRLYFTTITEHGAGLDDASVVMTPVISEEAMIELLREHDVPERYWIIGYYHDPNTSYAFHFTPISREEPSCPDS